MPAQFLEPMQSLPSQQTMVAAGPPLGGAGGGQVSLTNFAVPTQEQDQWCWAAVSLGVALFFGQNAWSQCGIASAELSPLNCCGPDASGPCNQPWRLDLALSRVGHFFKLLYMPATLANLRTEISAGRPMGCRIGWSSGNGHFVALGGYSTDATGANIVEVHDPYYGFVQTAYNTFCTAYRSAGSWTHSYLILGPTPVAGGGSLPFDAPTSGWA